MTNTRATATTKARRAADVVACALSAMTARVKRCQNWALAGFGEVAGFESGSGRV